MLFDVSEKITRFFDDRAMMSLASLFSELLQNSKENEKQKHRRCILQGQERSVIWNHNIWR